ncbi:MAG TPA: hypothetical protein PKM43_19545 [Verrucomicrobiota bacterium]|nr:hypothetical protein [Verrucomicrobiota bacterium]
MTTYWDTSAVMNAAVNGALLGRLADGEVHLTRTHTFAEFFNRMTGRGVRWTDADGREHALVFDADAAAKWLKSFAGKVGQIDLDRTETLEALTLAKSKGVAGRGVHDWLHVRAAAKAGADRVFTRDREGFSRLGAVVAWPD